MNTKEVAEAIKLKYFENKPIIVAIDGFGGAGKSTLAKALKNELPLATIVEVDDFFLLGVKSDANKSNFHSCKLEEQVLKPLTGKVGVVPEVN